MSIKLVLEGKPPIELDGEEILLGSDPNCAVAFPDHQDIKPQHAVIRLIDDRWIIEVKQAEVLIIDGTKPKKAHWLTPGDQISLTDNGPSIQFDPPPPPPQPPRKSTPRPSDVVLLPDRNDAVPQPVPLPSPKSSATVPVKGTQSSSSASTSTTIKTTKPPASGTFKPPSSAIIQIPKPSSSSSSASLAKPPSSKTLKTVDAPSTATMKTTTSTEVVRGSKSSDNLSRPGTDSRNSGTMSQRSSEKIKIPKSESAEPEAKLPVLKRLTSYEIPISPDISEGEAVDDWEGVGRRRRAKDKDIDFIKSVVMWSVGVGVGIIILYICISELINANRAPKPGAATTSTRAIGSQVVSNVKFESGKFETAKFETVPDAAPHRKTTNDPAEPRPKSRSLPNDPNFFTMVASMQSMLDHIDASLIERKLPRY